MMKTVAAVTAPVQFALSGLRKWFSPKRSASQPMFRPALESLETRDLLSATAIGAVINSSGDPASFAIIGSAGNSLWEYNPQFNPTLPLNQRWAQITPANVSQISVTRNAAGQPVVFATIASAGNSLWEYNPAFNPAGPINSHWLELTPATVAQISAVQSVAGDPMVFATIGSAGNSLWAYNPTFDPTVGRIPYWTELTPASVSQISATHNSAGEPVVFAAIASAGNSLWQYNPMFNPALAHSAYWNELTPAPVSQISATQNALGDPVVFATIASAGNSLWQYNPVFGPGASVGLQWTELTPAAVGDISAGQNANGDAMVFAVVASAGNSLWEYNTLINPTAPISFHWAQLTPSAVSQISATQDSNGAAVFAAVASDFNTLWENNSTFNPGLPLSQRWVQLTPASIA
jgi:hypothetical protein